MSRLTGFLAVESRLGAFGVETVGSTVGSDREQLLQTGQFCGGSHFTGYANRQQSACCLAPESIELHGSGGGGIIVLTRGAPVKGSLNQGFKKAESGAT